MSEHKFPYIWRLADGYPAKGIEHHGLKVFGTFICGGGSSMGYKLAGYEHLGGVELDPKVAATYKANHHPKYLYNEDIREFNNREDLPDELFNLDILDGSPPCTTFSMAGQREKVWGKEKRFAEGQKLQTLDDLVFVYCDTIAKLKPKVCLLENVSGIVKGNSKSYAKRIMNRLREIGYKPQCFLLQAATMGVPQYRQRVFFIGLRNDFSMPSLELNFNEPPIPFKYCYDGKGDKASDEVGKAWDHRKPSDKTYRDSRVRAGLNNSCFNQAWVKKDDVCPTLITTNHYLFDDRAKKMSSTEILKVSTFPIDYSCDKPNFLCGMSVPPVMMAQISHQIYLQWLSKIK